MVNCNIAEMQSETTEKVRTKKWCEKHVMCENLLYISHMIARPMHYVYYGLMAKIHGTTSLYFICFLFCFYKL